ncbi:MAG TPA: Ig-like domain-containing protein [Candidatus Saccharimonadales bacterium]|nr:Ig-like domain-containing protein [Candidatus Saccharimonadales bacterium]
MIRRLLFMAVLLGLGLAAPVYIHTDTVAAEGVTTVKLDTSLNPNARVVSSPVGVDCPGDCDESFAPGTAVTMTAAPVDGFSLYKWTVSGTGLDGCSESTDTTDKCSFTVPSDGSATVKATWRYNKTQLKVSTIGEGAGTVTGGYMIICGTGGNQCSYEYPLVSSDSNLSFTAAPDAGSVFAGWDTTGTVCFDSSGSKPAVNTSATCSFVLPATKKTTTLVARFEKAPPQAAAAPAGSPKLTSLVVDGDAVSLTKDVKIPYKQSFTIAGTAAPKAQLNVYVYSDPKKYSVTADDQGEWSYEIPGLAAGSHHIEIATVDAATKREAAHITLLSFTVDPATTKKVTVATTSNKKDASFPWLFVVIIVLLVGGAAAFVWYMRRKKKNTPTPPRTMGPPIGQQPPDSSGTPTI